MLNLRHQLIHDVVEPLLVALNAPALVAALVRPGLAVNGVAGEDHDLARVDPRAEDVVHVEVLKVEKAPRLAGNEQDGLAAVSVDLELHVPVETAAVLLEIAGFHRCDSPLICGIME